MNKGCNGCTYCMFSEVGREYKCYWGVAHYGGMIERLTGRKDMLAYLGCCFYIEKKLRGMKRLLVHIKHWLMT